MTISPANTEERAPSKFHGPYHEQLRMQAKMRRLEAFRIFLEGKPLKEIADTLQVDYSTVWRYIHQELQACRFANAERVEAVRRTLDFIQHIRKFT